MSLKNTRSAKAIPDTQPVRMSWSAYQKLDAFRSKQLEKTGKKPALQDLITIAVEEFLKKRGA